MRVLDGIDSGSQYQFGDKLQRASFPRSAFDLSHLFTTTVNNAGSIFPVMCKEVLPSDSWQIKINALLRVLPQVVPLYSRQRVYFDGFFVRCSDTWKHWNTYMSKGKSGNTVLTRPSLTLDNVSTDGLTLTPDGSDFSTCTSAIVQADSIYDYMGIPVGTDLKALITAGYHIDALPFMALQQIYRWYYLNKNAFIDDNAMFPEDDSDFRLDNNGNIISFNNSGLSSSILGSNMWRLWAQDYFTSALPFAQRGTAPTLPFSFSLDSSFTGNLSADSLSSSVDVNNNNYLRFGFRLDGKETNPLVYADIHRVGSEISSLSSTYSSGAQSTGTYSLSSISGGNEFDHKLYFNNVNFDLASFSGSTSVVLDDIRRLAISQLELERMARTDGTYEEFGLTFYGITSRNAIDFKPVYIGSCYQDVSFSEVLQTSETGSSPLGAYAGHGVSVTNDGNLGVLNADDYGYVIILCSIMPDVYYCQGLDRMYTKSIQEEEFLPQRDKMGMRPILNQELYLSGTKEVDEDLFAYQNPFDEYRYLQNEIHGKLADVTNLSFSPYTQFRSFDSTPNWNNNFLQATDVRKDYLAAMSEDAYTMQVRFDIRAVRPLSYIASPAEVIN